MFVFLSQGSKSTLSHVKFLPFLVYLRMSVPSTPQFTLTPDWMGQRTLPRPLSPNQQTEGPPPPPTPRKKIYNRRTVLTMCCLPLLSRAYFRREIIETLPATFKLNLWLATSEPISLKYDLSAYVGLKEYRLLLNRFRILNDIADAAFLLSRSLYYKRRRMSSQSSHRAQAGIPSTENLYVQIIID